MIAYGDYGSGKVKDLSEYTKIYYVGGSTGDDSTCEDGSVSCKSIYKVATLASSAGVQYMRVVVSDTWTLSTDGETNTYTQPVTLGMKTKITSM